MQILKTMIAAFSLLHSIRGIQKTASSLHLTSSSPLLYTNALQNKETKLVVGVGPAGTGKTYLACKSAIEALKKKEVNKIILTRPLISVAQEEIGFLPGHLNKKMSIWIQPMMDVFKETLSKKDLQKYIDDDIIEVTPMMYMRGRTFTNTFIIADEVQNTTPAQLFMLLTRMGENSKMVLTGDLQQSDLLNNKDITKNGLDDFIQRCGGGGGGGGANNYSPEIEVIHFNNSDVCRSKLVQTILDIYKGSSLTSRPTPPPPPIEKSSPPPVVKTNTELYDDYSSNNDCALIPLKDVKRLKDRGNYKP